MANPAAAQKYSTATGVRLGSGNYGITVQQAVAACVTIEGIAGLSQREYSGHLGHNKDTGDFSDFDGIVGAEYKVAFLPLVLSFDFKPSLEIKSDDYSRFPTAFSICYVFIKRKNGLFKRFRHQLN